MSCSSTITSPTLMPTRNSMRFCGGVPAFLSVIPRWTSTAQRTPSTTLGNSARKPSPVFLTIRPRCSAIFGSTSSRRCAFSVSCVPSSSTLISREYPAKSAARRHGLSGGKVCLTKSTAKTAAALASRWMASGLSSGSTSPRQAGYMPPPPPPPSPSPCSGLIPLSSGE